MQLHVKQLEYKYIKLKRFYTRRTRTSKDIHCCSHNVLMGNESKTNEVRDRVQYISLKESNIFKKIIKSNFSNQSKESITPGEKSSRT